VAFSRISGGVSLHAVISIIHNFVIIHFISQYEIGKKIKQKLRQIKFIFCVSTATSNSWPVTNKIILIPDNL
jgi:hypothetical protein